MSATDRALDAIRAAGYEVRHHTLDDVDRVYIRGANPFAPMRLVGMVVVREGRIRYAEMLGTILPWWGASDETPEQRDVVTARSLEQLRTILQRHPA